MSHIPIAQRAPRVTAAKPEKGVTASNYNSRAWKALVAGDAEAAERAVRTGLVLEPKNVYLLTNMAHVYLFSTVAASIPVRMIR